MAEIDFDNVINLSYQQDGEDLEMLISLRRPVGVRKRLREHCNQVRSPFNMHTEN